MKKLLNGSYHDKPDIIYHLIWHSIKEWRYKAHSGIELYVERMSGSNIALAMVNPKVASIRFFTAMSAEEN